MQSYKSWFRCNKPLRLPSSLPACVESFRIQLPNIQHSTSSCIHCNLTHSHVLEQLHATAFVLDI